MNRYLIEVPHEPSHDECPRLAASLLRAGVHFATRAGWGCEAGEHRTWLCVEAICDEDAALVVPPILRPRAQIVRLSSYSPDELADAGRDVPVTPEAIPA